MTEQQKKKVVSLRELHVLAARAEKTAEQGSPAQMNASLLRLTITRCIEIGDACVAIQQLVENLQSEFAAGIAEIKKLAEPPQAPEGEGDENGSEQSDGADEDIEVEVEDASPPAAAAPAAALDPELANMPPEVRAAAQQAEEALHAEPPPPTPLRPAGNKQRPRNGAQRR